MKTFIIVVLVAIIICGCSNKQPVKQQDYDSYCVYKELYIVDKGLSNVR